MKALLVISCILVVSSAFRPSKVTVAIAGRCSRVERKTFDNEFQCRNPNSRNQLRRSNMKLFTYQLSDDNKKSKDDVKDLIHISTSSPLLERVRRGLARIADIVPKPILMTVVTVASGLLFFELSKTLMLLALPVIVILGGVQSIKEGIEESVNGPRVFDTEMIDTCFVVNDPMGSSHNGEFSWDRNGKQSTSTSNSFEELERQSRERSGRLAAIQRRISETSGDLKSAISSATLLRDKLSNYVDKIDRVTVDTVAVTISSETS